MQLKLTAEQIEPLIMGGFEREKRHFYIEELQPGFLRMRMPFRKWMVRPGDVLSGPALFTAADLAMYAIVLAHVGPVVMAVTANLNMNFLNKGRLEDVLAEATLLKLGSKLAVADVKLRTGDDPTLVAHVTGSYSLPSTQANG